MAPELRKRKSKEAGISAAKPAPKTKADAPATKRKAAEDASLVAAKKSKPAKDDGRSKKAKTSKDCSTETKASKGARSKGLKKKDEDDVTNENENIQLSDDEQDDADAQALAKIIDSDDEDAIVDVDAEYQEGQDVGEIPKESKKMIKSSKLDDGERGVVYVGRLPHGFYEHEMRSYFSQFGAIEKLRMSRNKKTGASRHFAFIEFAEAPVAAIVAKTMDNYLLFGRVLKVKVVPKSQIHDDLWKGSNKRFKKVPWNKMAGNLLKKPLSESTWTQKITKEEEKRNKRAKKLQDMGYEFEGPKIKSVDEVEKDPAALEEGTDGEAQKTIEAAPEVDEAEAPAVEEEAKSDSKDPLDSELAVKKPAKAKKQDVAKSSKKAKKSSKVKKAAA
ncbi:hypothetical protein F4677DRAFT_448031 [Hypoxylon crocopeplum]|nr:hypothetical protein F4677DRAFT_448031 [Hypoxylon crocopeplum]